jgi:hypothetical protein
MVMEMATNNNFNPNYQIPINSLILREVKNSPLEFMEVDSNFNNLQDNIFKLDSNIKILTAFAGVSNGLATLDSNGQLLDEQLPYIDADISQLDLS